MKKWTKAIITILASLAISTVYITVHNYLQQSQYQGYTFTNEQSTTISNVSTDTSVYDSSTTSEPSYSSGTNSSNRTESNQYGVTEGTTPASQPTFEVVSTYSNGQDMYYVVHRPTGDKSPMLSEEDANDFCSYMERIAHGKETLSYSLQQNYNTWKN